MLATQSFLMKDNPTLPEFMSATGGIVDAGTTDGDYKYHVFNGDDDFIITDVGTDSTYGDKIQWMMLAGGGGGGGGYYCGGGGAGGYRTNGAYDHTVTATTYAIDIGAGGPGNTADDNGTVGVNSIAFGETATGGGYGARNQAGGPGGSSGGGGSTGGYSTLGYAGGTPIFNGTHTLGLVTHQGRLGGEGWYRQGGGGGGAGAIGDNGNHLVACGTGGNGGAGTANSITGSSVTYGGGGGGGAGLTACTSGGGAGGSGGGGVGSSGGTVSAGDGTDNTGGGGGGASNGDSNTEGGDGGDGVVIIRYKFQ